MVLPQISDGRMFSVGQVRLISGLEVSCGYKLVPTRFRSTNKKGMLRGCDEFFKTFFPRWIASFATVSRPIRVPHMNEGSRLGDDCLKHGPESLTIRRLIA